MGREGEREGEEGRMKEGMDSFQQRFTLPGNKNMAE